MMLLFREWVRNSFHPDMHENHTYFNLFYDLTGSISLGRAFVCKASYSCLSLLVHCILLLGRFSKYLINCHCGTVVRQSYTTASGQLHLCFDEEGQEDVEM